LPVLGLLLATFLQPADDHPHFTEFQLSREKEGHKVSVRAKLKNPGPVDLADLWVCITYFDGERELRASKPQRLAKLAPRETAAVVLEARQVEKFNRYEVGIETDTRKFMYAGTAGDELPKFQRIDRTPEQPAPAGPTVELCGLKWFDRDPLETRLVGSGDTPFLRFVVRQKGLVQHPTGKIQVMVSDGKKPLKYMNISLEDGCYQRDAAELNGRTALPETTAYDPITGEIWVGLIRVDHSKVALRLDVTLTFEGKGTWEWKEMEKVFTCAPRGPEAR
jgi:hypothetical protein